MKLNVQNISQKDPKHKNKKLGTSTVCTIGSDGCLLCDVAAICNYHGKTITVAELNDALVKVKGFHNGALLVYSAITQVFPDITFDWDVWEKGNCADVPAPLDLIDDILASNRVPIVKVDFNPQTSKLDQHWVCIIGKDEVGSYFIMDPIDGTTQYFQARYQDPSRYIFRIVAYSGPKETQEEKIYTESEMSDMRLERDKNWDLYQNSQEELADVEKDNQELKSKVANLKDQIASLNKAMEKMATEDHDSAISELEMSEKLEECKIQVKKATDRVLELEGDMDMARDTEKMLRDALASSGKLDLSDYTTKDLIRELLNRIFGRR